LSAQFAKTTQIEKKLNKAH